MRLSVPHSPKWLTRPRKVGETQALPTPGRMETPICPPTRHTALLRRHQPFAPNGVSVASCVVCPWEAATAAAWPPLAPTLASLGGPSPASSLSPQNVQLLSGPFCQNCHFINLVCLKSTPYLLLYLLCICFNNLGCRVALPPAQSP